MNGSIAIICDFDGTIAERDIGHHFFGTFISDKGKWEDLLERWKVGLISSRECLESELEWTEADRKDLDRFIEKEDFDPYFKDFVDFCNRRKYEFLIVSDGLDYYIDRLLMKHGLGYLDYRANKLIHNGNSLIGIDFPYYDLMGCKMCGNCKKHHLEKLKGEGYYTVYIGNGLSDRCPAEEADLVLAKADLLDHCKMTGIEYIPFENFRDVEGELTTRLILREE